MAIVKGPLFSLDASGSIGGAITFSKWKGRAYVRQRVVPSNPKSGAQVGRRAMMKFASQYWATISAADQATWETLADQLTASRFNAYISENMAGWNNYLAPSEATPPTRSGTPGVGAPPLAAIWEENRIKLSVKIDTLNDNWGCMIFASLTGTFTTTVGNCILIVPAATVATVDWFWTPPAAVGYYFNHRFFTLDGLLDNPGTEIGPISP